MESKRKNRLDGELNHRPLHSRGPKTVRLPKQIRQSSKAVLCSTARVSSALWLSFLFPPHLGREGRRGSNEQLKNKTTRHSPGPSPPGGGVRKNPLQNGMLRKGGIRGVGGVALVFKSQTTMTTTHHHHPEREGEGRNKCSEDGAIVPGTN